MTHVQGNILDRLASGMLDSLDAHMAVIGPRGTIVAANRAWTRFAAQSCAIGGAGVGADYLGVCERAARAGDESARAMLRGCRGLLAGGTGSLAIEYSCHSAERRRWLVAHVTAFAHEGATYLAVVHEDVTERMIAQGERMTAEHELLRAKLSLEAANLDLQAVLAHERVEASTDALTGLCNRRHFFERAAQMAAEARRYGTPFSIVLLAVDPLTRFDDDGRRAAGDRVLRCVARVARDQMRGSDLLCRYGGEEFAAALPHTNGEHALAAAEKLRTSVPACGRGRASGAGVTLSAGVAELAGPSEPLESLIRRADAALGEARRAGGASKLAPAS